MKLYNRTEFLKLPAGVFYVKGVEWAFDEVGVKGETVAGVDWYAWSPNGIDFDDTGQMIDRYEAMKATGCSFPLDESEVRDGLFDQDAIFLVFEPDDLRALRDRIDVALKLTEPKS